MSEDVYANSVDSITISIGGRDLKIETGKMARQAHGAVLLTYGETVVLVTAVGAKEARENQDFFPLTVEYRERYYAAGKYPGGFFKREGRPGDRETISARLIDRPIRPLFPDNYFNEVQIIAMILSTDRENDASTISMIGAAAALGMSPIPFKELIAGVVIGELDGELVVNPPLSKIDDCTLNLVVAGSKDAIMMVEAGANEHGEDRMLEALELAHNEIKRIISELEGFVARNAKPKWDIPEPPDHSDIENRIREMAYSRIEAVNVNADKQKRGDDLAEILEEVQEALAEDFPEQGKVIKNIFEKFEKEIVRDSILNKNLRSDSRALEEIRPITCEVNTLGRTHGSALFTRGQTQSLSVVTLGTVSDEQRIDDILGESTKRFMLHYNFPPFSVGEARFLRGPGRREIGHGALAERSLEPMMPSADDFPYTVRLVSEILESNGSSSMASVCAGSMAMMDAGVKMKAPVAGIAMGLIVGDDKVSILSDILGVEDHYGDMDFKVAGTENGITALQMDIKVGGISREIMAKALEQAKAGRLHILEQMKSAIETPRDELSPHAPRIYIIHIDPEKIGDVIGPGGKTIRAITAETEVKIDIEDDGTVTIASDSSEGSDKAIQMIEYLTAEVEIGKIYEGKVVRLMNFGAFVEILPGKDGLVHISELEEHRVENVEDVVKEGDVIHVKVIEVDSQNRINLSRKQAVREMLGKPPVDENDKQSQGGGRQMTRRDESKSGYGGGDRGRRSGGGGGGGGGGDRGRGRNDRNRGGGGSRNR